MPLSVEDVVYFTLTEVAEKVARRRETVWRWIAAEKVPQGRRYRDKERLFTEAEMYEIHAYAHRLEPIEPDGDPKQMNAFEQREGTA
jgi:hypothetical protein